MSHKKKLIEQLSDFCLLGRNTAQRLSNFERLTLIGGQELEKAVSWFAKQLSQFTYLDQFGHFDVDSLNSAIDYYSKFTKKNLANNFFLKPEQIPEVDLIDIHGLPNGNVVDVTFPSVYQVQAEQVRSRFDQYSENKRVHARWWKHSAAGAPLIIAVHGWTMGDQRINSLAFQPGYFYRMGFDVVLFELPFHGRRAPLGNLANTTIFPSTDFVLTNEALAQAISDLRQLYKFLIANEYNTIGVMGMSLGGYVSTLWSSLDTLSFCIPIVPLVSMSELAWQILSSSSHAALYLAQGVSKSDFEKIYQMHCPLNYQAQLEKDRILIIAGLSDSIVPPEQPRLLWEHWDKPNIFWFEGGHLAEAGKSRAFPEIAKFFRRLNLISTVPN